MQTAIANTVLGSVACNLARRNVATVEQALDRAHGSIADARAWANNQLSGSMAKSVAADVESGIRALEHIARAELTSSDELAPLASATAHVVAEGQRVLTMFDGISRTAESMAARQVVADSVKGLLHGRGPTELQSAIASIEHSLRVVGKSTAEVRAVGQELRAVTASFSSGKPLEGVNATLGLARGMMAAAQALHINVPPEVSTAVNVASKVVSGILSSGGNPLSLATNLFGGLFGQGPDPELAAIRQDLQQINAKLDAMDKKLDEIVAMQHQLLSAIGDLEKKVDQYHAEEMEALKELARKLDNERSRATGQMIPWACRDLLHWAAALRHLSSQHTALAFPTECMNQISRLLPSPTAPDQYLFVDPTGTSAISDGKAMQDLWAIVRSFAPAREPVGLAISPSQVIARPTEPKPWFRRFWTKINPTYMDDFVGVGKASYVRLAMALDGRLLLNVLDWPFPQDGEKRAWDPNDTECYAQPIAQVAVWAELFAHATPDAESAWRAYIMGSANDQLPFTRSAATARELVGVLDLAIEQYSLLEGAASAPDFANLLASSPDNALRLATDRNLIARRNVMLYAVAASLTHVWHGAYEQAYLAGDRAAVKQLLMNGGFAWAANGLTIRADVGWIASVGSVDFELPTPAAVRRGTFEMSPTLRELIHLKQLLVLELAPLTPNVVSDNNYRLLEQWIRIYGRPLLANEITRVDPQGRVLCGR